ncbi:hypothetical protein CDL12_26062 [Handroanthus impetiginosus]|uniref:Myb/SANT-like domain-containing protein n=1 Tax=Handroanthus impetiginosus TaxID=429701 RepID=A0A2G9G8X0_9LAMI|nr:hypothetical protein CDL12_26062 [Handroanthus impetiginosus]
MENEGTSKHGKRRERKVDSKRRIWTIKEEEALIVTLKDVVAAGWKCENGFHTGGFGWNESTNMIIIEDSIWDNYVKVDPNARTMRYKSFPLYLSWCEIFGKDRATSEHAEDCTDAADDGFDTNFQIFVDGEEFMSVYQPQESGMKTGSSSKKRKSTEMSTDNKFFEMMNNFCDRTESRLSDIAKRIGYEYDVSEARKAIYEALGGLPDHTMIQKSWVAKRLVNNGKDMDLFFSLPNEASAEMVQMMLDGAY